MVQKKKPTKQKKIKKVSTKASEENHNKILKEYETTMEEWKKESEKYAKQRKEIHNKYYKRKKEIDAIWRERNDFKIKHSLVWVIVSLILFFIFNIFFIINWVSLGFGVSLMLACDLLMSSLRHREYMKKSSDLQKEQEKEQEEIEKLDKEKEAKKKNIKKIY